MIVDQQKHTAKRVIKILIIEDEAAAVRRLNRMIDSLPGRYIILDALDSIDASLRWFENNDAPDVLLLDIHLADGSGFMIFENSNINCAVIFVTAFDEYAVDAFRVHAIDYLLKPIKKPELEQALNKVQSSHSGASYDELIQTLQEGGLIKRDKRVLVKIGQSIKLIDLDSAAYYYTKDKITFAIMPDSKRYPLEFSLEKLNRILDTRLFFQINRQFIVNVNAIQSMYSFSKSRVKINLNPTSRVDIIVSTERSPRFKKWLTGQF